ncbi:MAG: thioredoxin domain-containing protein [Candidatus Pacebacteria bacterium]|nr:thioredoxin domain-containing protein [Candidatus Paceibacterota bacterium]
MEPLQKPWLIPTAIILAGALIAISLFIVRSSDILGTPKGDPASFRPLSEDDHLVGNPEAQVIIIEYADIDSEHAKSFHESMGRLMNEYGSTGKVAWVYRHFPLVDKNINSIKHAEASECAAALGGERAFWGFIDAVHASAPGGATFDPSGYTLIAKGLGISESDFVACTTKRAYKARVNEDFANAIDSGATASPYSILVVEGKKPAALTGSIPYDGLKQIVDEALRTEVGQ